MPDRPQGSMYWEDYNAILKKIDDVLTRERYISRSPFRTPDEPTHEFGFNGPERVRFSNDYVDDPIGEAALMEIKRQYPNMLRRIGSVGVGLRKGSEPLGNKINALGVTAGDPLTKVPRVGIIDSSVFGDDAFRNTMNTWRHELAHVGGLGHDKSYDDFGHEIPTAYDVGDWSDQLNTDIELPPEPPKGISPSERMIRRNFNQ